ncbi:hypothetical protein O6H91_13G050400 [Diphasiastrum complanatum]|uniref:Uncharacterized protein n=1 Tax=Diphasiastrum complanatum TaxID=34168 RepID=A0ACC2BUM5_DIPCM|nr:hypothetical protein O6H91_13G050400 [Diphasiastrum complanatum]
MGLTHDLTRNKKSSVTWGVLRMPGALGPLFSRARFFRGPLAAWVPSPGLPFWLAPGWVGLETTFFFFTGFLRAPSHVLPIASQAWEPIFDGHKHLPMNFCEHGPDQLTPSHAHESVCVGWGL